MFRYAMAAFVFLSASMDAHAATSLRVGSRVLTIGDTAVRVQELMGEPAARTFMPPQSGGLPDNQLAAGEQWQYVQDGKTIIITIVGGRVTHFETVY